MERKKNLCSENLQNLFLAEVYIEKINIDYRKLCLTKESLDSLKEVYIHVQFLGLKPIEIDEEEFADSKGGDCNERIIQVGKTYIFSLRDLNSDVRGMELHVNVFRKRGNDSDCMLLGSCSIKLGEKFVRILSFPTGRTQKTTIDDIFSLFDRSCRKVGHITMTFSLSCFGKMITTSFQMEGNESKAYVAHPGGEIHVGDYFNANNSNKVAFCPNDTGEGDPGFPNMTQNAQQWPGFHGNMMGYGQGGLSGYGNDMFGGMPGYGQQMPCGMAGYSNHPGLLGRMHGYGRGPGLSRGGMAGHPAGLLGGSRGYTDEMPEGMVRHEGGLLGGRVCEEESSSETSSSSSIEDIEPICPPPPYQLCSCDYSVPPGFESPHKIGQKNKKKKKKKKEKQKKKKTNVPPGVINNFCQNPGCPMGYPPLPVIEEKQKVCQKMEVPPGGVGMIGEQMIFQMPKENQPLTGNTRTRFNFSGGIDNNLHDVRIMKDGEVKKPTLPTPTNDVFIMKIGKLNQESDQRQRMIVELLQPRSTKADEKPVCNRGSQYLEADTAPFKSDKLQEVKSILKKGKSKKGKSEKGKSVKGKSKKGKSEKGKSVKGKSVKAKSEKGKSVKGKSVKAKSEKGKSVKGKSVKGKSVKPKSEEGKSVKGKSVQPKSPIEKKK